MLKQWNIKLFFGAFLDAEYLFFLYVSRWMKNLPTIIAPKMKRVSISLKFNDDEKALYK